ERVSVSRQRGVRRGREKAREADGVGKARLIVRSLPDRLRRRRQQIPERCSGFSAPIAPSAKLLELQTVSAARPCVSLGWDLDLDVLVTHRLPNDLRLIIESV